MKITSWNVNGIRACYKKGLTDFIKSESPDILCLQETKAHPDQLDESLKFQNIYPISYWSSCSTRKGYSGTCTYLKTPSQNHWEGIGIKKFDREGRFVITEHSQFILLNIYFPNGALTEERHLFKQEFLQRILFFLKRLEEEYKKPLILVGDYNVAYLDQDVFSPETLQKTSGFLPEEKEWFKNFLNQDFIDIFRHFYPEKKDVYTWWSHRENARRHNRGWRIDHVCVSKSLKDKVKSIKILDEQMGSDHCPVTVELKLTK